MAGHKKVFSAPVRLEEREACFRNATQRYYIILRCYYIIIIYITIKRNAVFYFRSFCGLRMINAF
jgi:hypothetical protein